MTATTKYIVHFQGYSYLPKTKVGSTKTFRKLESALSYLRTARNFYRNRFEDNDYHYSDGSGPIAPEKLEEQIATYFYIEKQVIVSERLDY